MSRSGARPNVLWIFCDELRTDALSCYGNAWVDVATPNIDRIAASGTRFDRFYVDSPVCVSSRYAMLTGRTPARTGVYHNDAMALGEVIEAAQPFTRAFARAGYRVADFGKGHVPTGLDAFTTTTPDGANQFELMAVAEEDADRVTASYGGTLAATWPEGRPYPPEAVTDGVVRYLTESADDDDPFFVRASFLQPHTPVIVPERWASRYDSAPWPETVEACPELSAFESRYGEQGGMQHMSPGAVRSIQSRYHGVVAWIDDQVGRILGALEASGRVEDTVVVFCSDHGALLGELGGGIGKQVFAPPSHRVPFLLSWPGSLDQGLVDSSLAVGTDLASTLLDLAGVEPTSQIDGRSLISDPAPEAIFGMIGYGNTGARALSLVGWGTYVDERSWPQRACVRTADFRLDRNTRIDNAPVSIDDEDTFLAHTDSDPAEGRNVAADPRHRSALTDLSSRLDEYVGGAVVIDDAAITASRADLRKRIEALADIEGMEGAG